MSHLHLHRLARTTAAVVLLALQALGAAHLALEAHVVDDAGRLVELHALVETHTHEGDSVCDGLEREVGVDALDCAAASELTWQPSDACHRGTIVGFSGSTLPERPGVAASQLWLWAPKASPPARA